MTNQNPSNADPKGWRPPPPGGSGGQEAMTQPEHATVPPSPSPPARPNPNPEQDPAHGFVANTRHVIRFELDEEVIKLVQFGLAGLFGPGMDIAKHLRISPEIEGLLSRFLDILEPLMSKLTDAVDALTKSVDDALARDKATVDDLSNLNKQIADLKAQLAAGGLSPAEEDALADKLTALQGKIDALDASSPTTIGSDGTVTPAPTTNPVTGPPPGLTPPPPTPPTTAPANAPVLSPFAPGTADSPGGPPVRGTVGDPKATP